MLLLCIAHPERSKLVSKDRIGTRVLGGCQVCDAIRLNMRPLKNCFVPSMSTSRGNINDAPPESLPC
eukprot:354888-Chlamydomonas_euryale.AAC.4